MQNFRVASYAELIECLYEGSWNQPLRRFRSNFAFRGLADVAHNLKTGLVRLQDAYHRLEGHLLRNFRKYARSEASPGPSMWSWLSLAQHHGLPTRLLDWTYSPFVAMHFATEELELYNADAVIWCVDFVKTNQLLPGRLRRLLREEGSNVFTVEMLDRAVSTLAEFDRLARNIGGAGNGVKHDISVAQFGGGLARDAPHQRAQASCDFVDVKRLRHIVISPCIETFHLLSPAAARRQDQDRCGGPGTSQPP